MTLPYLYLAPLVNDTPAGARRHCSSYATVVELDGGSTFHPDHPDAQTIARIRDGDQAAFAQLFRDYYQRLWAFAHDLTGSAGYAEEVVQDVFAGIWIRRTEWAVAHSIAEYLFGAVRSHTYRMCRHLAIVARPALTVADDFPEGSSVADAIRAMPPGRRTTLLLRWHDGLSYTEIASVMGVSVKAASFQLSRIRDDLWALIEPSI